MRLVIADTGPINYLILTEYIDVLPAVHRWIADPPSWVEVRQTAHVSGPILEKLDPGEKDAIALAVELRADLILMDDRDGVLVARSRGFRVAGTLGILSIAAGRGLVDLRDAFERIKRTSFHYRQETMDQLLADASRSQ